MDYSGKQPERKKLCSNCDGTVPFESDRCPYCQTELAVSKWDDSRQMKNQAIQDSLSTSLYSAPYKNASPEMPKKAPEAASALPQEKEAKESVLPLVFLSLGTNLFGFGLLQLLFSDNGKIAIEWDASYWFIYMLLALPLCYFGFKKLSSEK